MDNAEFHYKNINFDSIHIPEEIISLINDSKTIAVIGHIEPDGDAVSSQLALVDSLNSHGWQANAINVGPFEKLYARRNKKRFLKEINQDYDLYIIVDTPNIDRVGEISNKIDLSRTIVIDHHISNNHFGYINWVEDKYVSTAEMIFLLLAKMDIGLDNKEICQMLFDGIISDNGYFLHIRSDKNFSLYVSFLLVLAGVDPRQSYKMLYGNKDIHSKKLMALAIQRTESMCDGQVLYTHISEEDRIQNNRTIMDSASIFKELMSVKDTHVVVLFKIYNDRIDISLRSDDSVDVSKIAGIFGGGGHKAAAGCNISGEFEAVKKQLLEEINKHIV